MRHVYQKALWGWQKMSPREALTEAVAILERGYPAAPGQGYDTAFVDASNPNFNGLEYILTQMARHITLMARQKHTRWVCASRIELSGWPTRCLIAQILLQRWEPFLPENLRTCSPAQLANHLPELINVVLSIDRTVSKILDVHIDFCDF